MPYNITRSDGTNLVTVPNSSYNQESSSLTLVGKNFAGYGEFINENFVHLLENFAKALPPANPIEGQLWWDKTNKILKVKSGIAWKAINTIMATSTPVSPNPGDLWWDPAQGQLKVWDEVNNVAQWVVIGPTYTENQAKTGAFATTVRDTLGTDHVITKLYVNDKVVGVISKSDPFTWESTPALITDLKDPLLPGFTTIYPGLTLVDSSGANGITGVGYYGTPHGSGAYLTGIPNGALVNSAVTYGNTTVSLGGTSLTLSGLTSVQATNFYGAFNGSGAGLTGIPPSAMSSSAITIGTTSITLGTTSSTLAGLTSISATTLNGSGSGLTAFSVANASLVNSTLGIGGTYKALGENFTSLSGLTSVTAGTFNGSGAGLTNIPNSALSGGITIGSTTIALGGTSTTLSGLTSISSSALVGTLSTAAQPNITSLGALTNLTVTGDLTVNGTTTTVNSTTLDVVDLNITMAKNAASAAAANGGGITLAGANAQIYYTSADDRWNFNKGINAPNFYGTFNGSGAGLTSIPLSALSGGGTITIGTTAIAVGGTSLTLGGLTSVTATNFYGQATSIANQQNSATIAASSSNGSETIVRRDVSGNFSAGIITATCTQANYADLAERFAADAQYAPGTVVELGGVEEITAAMDDLSENVFGVISTRAAYLMNAKAGTDLTHPPVAMQGRVPVRVIGQIKKGDRLVSAGNGLARAASRNEITSFNVIGRSLQNKTTNGEGTVEVIVKLNS